MEEDNIEETLRIVSCIGLLALFVVLILYNSSMPTSSYNVLMTFLGPLLIGNLALPFTIFFWLKKLFIYLFKK
tara:strand:- start:8 stop:226 length:219 start_codon:yes stop_codon:yes gene_type:complete